MHSDLIYDIGANNGDDTAYYLYKGFRVIAVEANPVLADKVKQRFGEYVENGQLTVLNVGIAEVAATATFWVNEQHDEWSSFIKEIAGRHNLPCYPVDVACVRLKDLFAEYGVPFCLKVDIEGNDIFCLHDLDKNDLPVYVSVEAHRLEYLCLLTALGYTSFKCIDQTDHNTPALHNNETIPALVALPTLEQKIKRKLKRVIRHSSLYKWIRVPKSVSKVTEHPQAKPETTNFIFAAGSSGPFGEDTFGEWEDLETTAYNWLHYRLGYKQRGTLNMNGWYDFHAKRES